MIALLQRVSSASVDVEGRRIAAIGPGLLVFIGVERGDKEVQAERLLSRILNYRIFADLLGKMNLSLLDVAGELLLVSQFTLAADTQKGLRPSFTPAADPHEGSRLYNYLVNLAQTQYPRVAMGQFGADMQVALVNTGPVTFWLRA